MLTTIFSHALASHVKLGVKPPVWNFGTKIHTFCQRGDHVSSHDPESIMD